MQTDYIIWDVDPEIFKLFGVSIRYYGVLFVSGLLLSIFMLEWMFRREGLPETNALRIWLYGLVGVLIGARLGHCLFYEPDYYMAHPMQILLPIEFTDEGGVKFIGYNGLASHGAGFGFIVALFIYSVQTKHAFIDVLDLVAVPGGLAAGFIRLANLMNSEIIGLPTDKPWAFIFVKIDNLPRHPAQLYETIAYFLIFILVFILYLKKREKQKNGFFIGLTWTLVFIARFFIEFFKENQADFENAMNFNMGQLLSIPYILFGLGFMGYSLVKTGRSNKPKPILPFN